MWITEPEQNVNKNISTQQTNANICKLKRISQKSTNKNNEVKYTYYRIILPLVPRNYFLRW